MSPKLSGSLYHVSSEGRKEPQALKEKVACAYRAKPNESALEQNSDTGGYTHTLYQKTLNFACRTEGFLLLYNFILNKPWGLLRFRVHRSSQDNQKQAFTF